MKNIIKFTFRNAKLFLRDRATFFFSILSSIIMICLYFLFIARIYIDGLQDNVPTISNDAAGFIVYLQMMAGVLILNSLSLSLGMFSGMAKDFESQRFSSFSTTPAKKWELLISYFIGGVAVSFCLNFFAWIVTVLLIGITTGFWVSVSTFFMAVLILFVATLISSSVMLLLTALAKSSTALGVINGIMGTFLGFICGIYMPYSNLGKTVETVGSFLPFTHLTIWLKGTVLEDAFNQVGITGGAKDALMNDWFTAKSIGFCGLDTPLWIMLIISGLIAAGCLAISWVLFRKKD